jgi:hypothetical protein
LHGLVSLIPLFLVWGGAIAAWVWLRRFSGARGIDAVTDRGLAG